MQACFVIATGVTIDGEALSVELAYGRTITAPTAWYPRLLDATSAERSAWRLIGAGRGIHGPDLDEDISVANLLSGQASTESQESLKLWLARRAK